MYLTRTFALVILKVSSQDKYKRKERTMNVKELKVEMLRHGDTCGELAKALGFSSVSMSSRLSGKTDFSRREIEIIRDRYDLSADRVVQIFLA